MLEWLYVKIKGKMHVQHIILALPLFFSIVNSFISFQSIAKISTHSPSRYSQRILQIPQLCKRVSALSASQASSPSSQNLKKSTKTDTSTADTKSSSKDKSTSSLLKAETKQSVAGDDANSTSVDGESTSKKKKVKLSVKKVKEKKISPPLVEVNTSSIDDFSKFKVGQVLPAKVGFTRSYGAVVNVTTSNGTYTVLLPRSVLKVSRFEKFKALPIGSDIRIRIIQIYKERRLLRGDYLSTGYIARPDISNIKEVPCNEYVARVDGCYRFGTFATIEESGIQGFIPLSNLPNGTTKQNASSLFKVGDRIIVKVEKLDATENKVLFSLCEGAVNKETTNLLEPSAESDKTSEGSGVKDDYVNENIEVKGDGYTGIEKGTTEELENVDHEEIDDTDTSQTAFYL